MELRFDYERSAMLAERVKAQPKECFRNSVLALVAAPDLFYCEGYVCIQITEDFRFSTEHGWLEDADGTVIDPTFAGKPGIGYFAARRWSSDEALDLVVETHEVPLVRFWFQFPEFIEAHDKAFAMCGWEQSE